MILDSGNRTEFPSGAVRDVQDESKGRCDLLPLDVVASSNAWTDWQKDVFYHIDEFTRGGNVYHLHKALDLFAARVFFTPANMYLEVAIHFFEGSEKYGPDNWKKGIPVRRYIDSAVRHFLKYLRGDKDERHDRAFCWNVICSLWTCKHLPALNEYTKE